MVYTDRCAMRRSRAPNTPTRPFCGAAPQLTSVAGRGATGSQGSIICITPQRRRLLTTAVVVVAVVFVVFHPKRRKVENAKRVVLQ